MAELSESAKNAILKSVNKIIRENAGTNREIDNEAQKIKDELEKISKPAPAKPADPLILDIDHDKESGNDMLLDTD